MNYTKGEWLIRAGSEYYDIEAKHPMGKALVATLWAGEHRYRIPLAQAQANAHLIAAAPELLGIVRQFVRYGDQWQQANGDFPNGDGRALILKNAKQALAKAEGVK